MCELLIHVEEYAPCQNRQAESLAVLLSSSRPRDEGWVLMLEVLLIVLLLCCCCMIVSVGSRSVPIVLASQNAR